MLSYEAVSAYVNKEVIPVAPEVIRDLDNLTQVVGVYYPTREFYCHQMVRSFERYDLYSLSPCVMSCLSHLASFLVSPLAFQLFVLVPSSQADNDDDDDDDDDEDIDIDDDVDDAGNNVDCVDDDDDKDDDAGTNSINCSQEEPLPTEKTYRGTIRVGADATVWSFMLMEKTWPLFSLIGFNVCTSVLACDNQIFYNHFYRVSVTARADPSQKQCPVHQVYWVLGLGFLQ